MVLGDDYKKAREKALDEEDIIRQIVMMHTLDVLGGTENETLSYVDVLYPAIEGLFGVDNCIEALGNKYVLRAFFESEFETDISYDKLCKFFINAKNTCTSIKQEQNYLKACEMVVNTMEQINKQRRKKFGVK